MSDKKTKPCFRCDGTGMLCNDCGESEAACMGDCQSENLAGHYACPDCNGVGDVLVTGERTEGRG